MEEAELGTFDLGQVFRQAQRKMLATLNLDGVFEHAVTQGMATEHQWITLLSTYLPKRYKVAPAFIINAAGMRSRQIDIAIYDGTHSAPLLPHPTALHLPIESVYAVIEVKALMKQSLLRDAGIKAASVRRLRRAKDTRPILSVFLSPRARWTSKNCRQGLTRALATLPEMQRVDIGCALEDLAFEDDGTLTVSKADQALMFLILRLIHRLDALGPASPPDLMRYVRGLRSFKR